MVVAGNEFRDQIVEMRFAEWQTAEKLLAALDDLMARAKLDYVDLWRPTCYWQPHTDHAVAHEEAMVEALEKAKKAGKVRFGGMSTHKHDWAMRMIQTYPQTIQAIVLPYTAGSKKAHMRVDKGKGGWQAVAEREGDSMYSLIDVVKESHAGWVGIKPFAGGSLFKAIGEKRNAMMILPSSSASPGWTRWKEANYSERRSLSAVDELAQTGVRSRDKTDQRAAAAWDEGGC